MNNEKTEFPIFNKLMLFMVVFNAGGMLAIGVWVLMKQVYGDIGNPAGAVMRLGMMAVFSIILWMIFIRRTKK